MSPKVKWVLVVLAVVVLVIVTLILLNTAVKSPEGGVAMGEGWATVLGAGIALVAALAVQGWTSYQNGKMQARETVLRIIDAYRADAHQLQADDHLALGKMQADLAVVDALVGHIRDADTQFDILVPPAALEPPRINEVTYKYFGDASEPLQKLWREWHLYQAQYEEHKELKKEGKSATDGSKQCGSVWTDFCHRLGGSRSVCRKSIKQAQSVSEKTTSYLEQLDCWAGNAMDARSRKKMVGVLKAVKPSLSEVPCQSSSPTS